MKKILILMVFGTFLSCNKEDCATPSFTVDQAQLAIDIEAIDNYLLEKGITAEVHDTGIRYQIVESGSTNRPLDCDKIYVAYQGELLNGTVFDATPNNSWATFVLSNLIPAWRIGIPLIEEGGEINLYVPSGYAYGSNATGSIPANSPLVFNIKLLAVLKEVD